jgi:hypothetical protein
MKKTSCFLLVVIVIVTIGLIPARAFASPHIDLSRIKFSSGREPLVLESGSLSFQGEVSQVFPFTKEEIDKIVMETLKAKKLTMLDIKEANAAVEKARRASEFTKEDVDRFKENMLTTLKTVPASSNVADVLKFIDDYMDSSSWEDVGNTSVDYLENTMADWVKDTASGFVDKAGFLGKSITESKSWLGKLNTILSFCDMMANEHMRTKQKWKAIADGANAKRLLNDFYSTLQSRIDSYKSRSDRAGWIINFNEAMDGRNFTFFGVDSNYQTWDLTMYMKKKVDQSGKNDFGSVIGDYEGYYIITAEHELSNFRSRAHEAIRNMKEFGEAIQKIENTPGYSVRLSTSSKGKAYIDRVISGDCTATIDKTGEITFNLDQKNDDTRVSISGIEVLMDYSTGGGMFKSGGKVTFQISAKEENIVIGGVSNTLSATAPDFNFSHVISGTGSVSVGWDDQIWQPWDDTEKVLRYGY